MIQRAEKILVPKPWGRRDLHAWGEHSDSAGGAVGEIWFRRPGDASPSSLLLKILFTSQPLSIQVHPDDALAHALGLPNGKTEAWYIMDADAGAACGIGLQREINKSELHAAIEDGSIQEMMNWTPVRRDDFIFVPAGTIHAIGAGVVLAEIQQSSDTTFRLFDYGRGRELHADLSVAASKPHPERRGANPEHARDIDGAQSLVSCPFFTLDLITLPACATARLSCERETWVLVMEGEAFIHHMVADKGDAIFLENEDVDVVAGGNGLRALAAHASPTRMADDAETSLMSATPAPTIGFAAPAGALGASTGGWVLSSEYIA